MMYLQYFVPIYILWLFRTVPWVGLQYAIMLVPGDTQFLFNSVK